MAYPRRSEVVILQIRNGGARSLSRTGLSSNEDEFRQTTQVTKDPLSDFVVAAAREAALRTIEQTHLIRLSVDEQRRFVDLLLNPPAPSPALLRARDAHAELIREPH